MSMLDMGLYQHCSFSNTKCLGNLQQILCTQQNMFSYFLSISYKKRLKGIQASQVPWISLLCPSSTWLFHCHYPSHHSFPFSFKIYRYLLGFGQVAQLDGASSCAPKGCRFDSRSEHISLMGPFLRLYVLFYEYTTKQYGILSGNSTLDFLFFFIVIQHP